jgi:hypothetical protein
LSFYFQVLLGGEYPQSVHHRRWDFWRSGPISGSYHLAIGKLFSITVDALDFKTGRVRRWVECHSKIVKEANLP